MFTETNFTLIIELPLNEIKKSNSSGNISKNLNFNFLIRKVIKFICS